MFEHTITLFCRFGGVHDEGFSRFVLHDVFCDGAAGQNAGVPAAQNADRALLVIPTRSAGAYVSPAVWRTLDAKARGAHFTLQVGDLFAEGIADTPAGAFVMTTVDEKNIRDGMAHFEIGGGRNRREGGGVA